MNEEKNNIGVNNSNSLPPMGTTHTNTSNFNNVHDKYGLPPISNFTNFNNDYETPKVDNNTSVFDLMEQFESVNKNTVNNNTVLVQNECTPSISAINNDTNVAPFNMFSGDNNISNNSSIPVVDNSLNTSIIQNNNLNALNVPNQNNQNSSINNIDGIISNNIDKLSYANSNNVKNLQPSISVSNNNSQFRNAPLNINNIPTNNSNISNQNIGNNLLDIFGGSSNTDSGFNEKDVKNNSEQISVSLDNNIKNNDVNDSIISDTMQNTNSVNNNVQQMPTVNSRNSVVSNDVNNQTIVSPLEQVIPVNNKENNNVQDANNIDNGIPSFSLNNNKIDNNVVEIPTTSIDNVDNSNKNNDLITNFNSADKINIDTNNVVVDTNNAVSSGINDKVKQKKKGHKLLFIILLLITIIIVAAVGVLSYFMFFKTDKLVCGLQDYSNDQFILDESMVIRFKGNKMSDAKLTQLLTFMEDSLDKKDSYLEELKNQYQGLGFNVSFVDNENGFEIDMNFTKSELESWYGTNLKNSSKTQMKKELRNSGYTCK